MDEKACQELINGSAEIHKMLGGKKEPAAEEQVTIDFAFATVVSIAPIKKGETFTKENIWVKRPGTGKIRAEFYNDILGKTATTDIASDAHIDWTLIEK
jgi:N-acetylneuraminate synthase